MVVGDMVAIVNTQTTGFENGTSGIITKKECVNRKDLLYWVFIGSHGRDVPFWESEIEIIDESWSLSNCS